MVKSLALSGTYVINNPFAASATNKLMEIQVGSRLGLTFPKTIVLPDRPAMDETDGLVTEPYLAEIAEELGFPCILKPFDGYAWEDVHVVSSPAELFDIYHTLSPRRILLAQQLIRYKGYFRVFCFDKQDVLFIKWIPKPSAMGHYLRCDPSRIEYASIILLPRERVSQYQDCTPNQQQTGGEFWELGLKACLAFYAH